METTINTATQEVAQPQDKHSKYVVSEKTAMFIDLLRQQDALFRDIINAVGKFYGEASVDGLMERDFHPILFSLRDAIFEYVKDSMSCNTGNTI